MFLYVLLYLGQLSYFPSFIVLYSKLAWAPFDFFAVSPLLWIRSWLYPFKKQYETTGIYVAGHPLLQTLYIALVVTSHVTAPYQLSLSSSSSSSSSLPNLRSTRLQGVSASEMTYIVSSGALHATHSQWCRQEWRWGVRPLQNWVIHPKSWANFAVGALLK